VHSVERPGPRLAGIAGRLEGLTAAIDNDLSIGRGGTNRLVIDDLAVAERHCLIRKTGDQLTLWAVDAEHPTFVNGVPANGLVLSHGDQIKIGTSLFLVLLTPDADPSPCRVHVGDLPAASMMRVARESLLAERFTTPVPADRVRHDLQSLLRISAALSSVRGLASLERPLLELIFEIIPAERGVVLLSGEHAREFASLYGCRRSGEPGGDILVSRTIAETVLRSGVAILSDDVREPSPSAEGAAPERRSVLAAPLSSFGRPLGVLYLDAADPSIRFDAGHLQLLTVIGGIASVAIENLRHIERLESANRRLQVQIHLEHEMVGEEPAMHDVHRLISRVAATDSTVLILGESGTGKELVARAIHRASRRSARPFVAINCAAVAETLFESELFGHERGAFTGAVAQKRGKLEVADGGTVFLDEISELTPSLQSKLLRVLQEHEFERVGGTRPVTVDIRVLAATNVDLHAAVAAGRFREDLHYRLNVVAITVPPLRARRGDIPRLAAYFAAKYSRKIGRRVEGIAPAAEALLAAYDWPGNVRELENAIERAVVLGATADILPEDLPETVLESEQAAGGGLAGYHRAVAQAKRDLIVKAVEEAGGSLVKAAKLLGLNPTYLHRLIRNLGLKAVVRRSRTS
jgi:Nif-specific regulatory protein